MRTDSGNKLAKRINSDMREVLRNSPRAIARIAINFMEDNFEKGGFQTGEGTLRKWAPRKNDEDPGRGLLIGKKSGRLQKSGTVFQADASKIVVGVPDDIAAYGKIHNEGGIVKPKVTVKMRKFAWFKYKQTKDEEWKWLALTKKKALNIKIPRRQFLGNSPELNHRIKVFFNGAFRKNLKGTITLK